MLRYVNFSELKFQRQLPFANDLGMLCTAGVGIAMGNGSDVAKTAADYVTTSMEEDGIWNGCRHLKLI